MTADDCLAARDFVERHVQAHSFGDCDVTVGRVGVAADPGEALEQLSALEAGAESGLALNWPNELPNAENFLGCNGRNFTIRRSALEEDLFDATLARGAAGALEESWFDVEAGYRLYRRALRIKPVREAVCLRLATAAPAQQSAGRRPPPALLDRHPEFAEVTRHWLAAPAVRAAGPRRLRILSYRWHVAHQYELFKLGHEFTLVSDLGSQLTLGWDYRQRPLPENAGFARWSEVDPRQFDLAILHFDENVLTPENTDGLFGPEWGATFRWFMEQVELPRIAVCHGTPQFRARQAAAPGRGEVIEVIEAARARLADYLGDTCVVCNSHQAQREWRFRNSRVIWHGFDPVEFPPCASPRHGILSPVGAQPVTRPHYLGQDLYREVAAGLPPDLQPSLLCVPDPSPAYRGNVFALWKFRNYVDRIRDYGVYFNPTLRSPMPRARGEPMMCGVPTVSARNHDVDQFIRNGVNGFFAESAEELREQLLFLGRNPAAARRVGQAGRRTALDVFNLEGYLAQWRALIRAVT